MTDIKPDEPLRDTFANVGGVAHRLKATAALLMISENTLRNNLAESGIEVKRANSTNPAMPAIRLFDLPTIFKIASWRRSKRLTKQIDAKRPIVIAVDLVKGGVGKSTTAVETAIHLQLSGFRTLLIDLDIQANSTQQMGYEADLDGNDAEAYNLSPLAIVNATFANLVSPMLNRSKVQVDASTIVKYPFGEYGPAVIPADTFFGDLEQDIQKSSGKRELVFTNFFNASINGQVPGLDVSQFDCVLLDCPPTVNFITTNALAAADIVVAPVAMEAFSVKGLSKLISELNALSQVYQHEITRPELIILPTFYSKSISRVERMRQRLSIYRKNIADTYISDCEEFPKATDEYLPLALIKPTSPSVDEYRAFTTALIRKMADIAKSKKQLASVTVAA